jgi:DNA mismatch endonuclease (patch repair protein)
MRARSGRTATTGLILDPETSARLALIPQRRTKPEQIVRSELHRRGKRFRVNHNRDLPGNPDVANRTARWAIFVHGCFWHHHDGCKRATIPKRNREFWLSKFAANRERDRRSEEALRQAGFQVITIWECEAEDKAKLDVILSWLAN